ncbi:MAG: hypothetical protein PHW46_01440 [Candidatus Omnitrophica bacterium]|nr:hypothetical protein [Candidatus Omnitrophota bacterium]
MQLQILKNKKGMTLAEVVVSAVLVLVVVGALVGAVLQGSVFSRRIDMIYTASYLAERRIEVLKRFDFDQIYVGEESNVRIDLDGNIDPNGAYQRSTEILMQHGGNPYLAKVKVTVGKIKINMDGTIDSTPSFSGNPVVVETLFADIS